MQRQSVTGLRFNAAMPSASKELEALNSVGKRVKYWRLRRNMSRKELALLVPMPVTTLSWLEDEGQMTTKKSRQIAEALGINLVYLETGKGEPEDLTPRIEPEKLPLAIDPRYEPLLKNLNSVERQFVEMKLNAVLGEIAAARPTRHRLAR